MNSAVFLAEENRQLRSENKRQKRKKAKKKAFIATEEVLTIEVAAVGGFILHVPRW